MRPFYPRVRPSQRARSASCGPHPGRHGRREGNVLVDGVDAQHAGCAVGGGVDLPDQAVTVEDGKRPVAPAPGGGRLVHLQLVVELEQLGHPLAVEHQPVQRRQQRGATLELVVELHRVDPPDTRNAGDDSGFARAADDTCAGDAEGADQAFVSEVHRVLRRDRVVVREDPVRQVPQPLPAPTAGHRHLAATRQLREHPGDVAMVVPAARPPRDDTGVREVARRERAVGSEPLEDVAAAGVVGLDPRDHVLHPPRERPLPRPVGHLRAVQREVLARPDHHVQLDETAFGQRALQVVRPVRGPHPAPQHEVGAGRHGRRLVDLKQGQGPDDVEQVSMRGVVEQLGADRDPPRPSARELVGPHGSCLPATTDIRAVGLVAVGTPTSPGRGGR